MNCWVVQRDAGKPYYECIVKQFKRSHAQYAAEWDKDLSVLERADALASKFNKDVAPRIEFASAFLYQLYQPGAEYQRTGWFSTTTTKVADASVITQEKVCRAFIQREIRKGQLQQRICREADRPPVSRNCSGIFSLDMGSDGWRVAGM